MFKFKSFVILTAIILSLCFVSSAKAGLVGNTTQATLTASPQTGTYNINDNFQVSIYVNTNSQNVVGVAAYLTYDKTHFQAVSIDTTGSVFTIEWEKIIDSTNGKIKISRTIPTPGVNTSNGLVAKINFIALSGTNPGSDNLTFDFTAGSNIDSGVIKDDGLGTDILSGVYNAKYTVSGGTGDTTPPTVSITSPTAGATVSGSSVTVSASASDNSGVVSGVQFKLDGNNLGAEDTASPFSISWNTTQTSNGSHTLTATARDAAGNQTTSSGVSVTVSNTASCTSLSLVGSSVSPTSVTAGGGYTIVCNYGATTNGINPSMGSGSCTFQNWTGTAANFSCTAGSTAGTFSNSCTLSNTSPDNYCARADTISSLTVTGTNSNDTTPPTIYSVSASSITISGATITWTTDESSDSQVEFGFSTSYGNQTTLNSSMTTSHSQTLSGLNANMTYHYRVKSRDAVGNLATSGDYTFTTGNPSCTSRSLVGGSVSSASVKKGGSYTVYCNYGVTTNGVNAIVGSGSCSFQSFSGTTASFRCTAGSTAGTFSNSCTLSNTTPDNYCARTDAIASLTVITATAPADKTPPKISSVSTSNITSDSATIVWLTSEPATSKVEYGLTNTYGDQTTIDNNLASNHSVNLDNLSSETTYHFRVRSKDQAKNESVSADHTFITQTDNVPPATIDNLYTFDITKGSLTLGWAAPGDNLEQGKAAAYDIRYSTAPITDANWESATKVTNAVSPGPAGLTQSVTINGLSPGTTYYFAIKTSDEVPNVSALSNVVSGTTKSNFDLETLKNFNIDILGFKANVVLLVLLAVAIIFLIIIVWVIIEVRRKSKYFD